MVRRKGAVILIVCLGLAFAALAGAVAYRAALIEAGLQMFLRGRGAPAELTVREVGWTETTLDDISLGAGAELRVRRLRLAYDPRDLVSGRLSDVEIDGAVLVLNATGAAPLLGSLQPLLDGARDAQDPGTGGAAVPIPTIRVRDARIEAATPLGPATAMLSGAMSPEGPGAARLILDIVLDTDRGWGLARLDAARALDGRLTGRVQVEDGALALPGAEIHGLRGEAAFAVRDGAVESATAALTLGTLTLPGVAFERARLDLRLSETEVLVETAVATSDGQLRLSATARAQDLDGRLALTLDAQAEVSAQAAIWAAFGLPAPAAGRATATVAVEAGLPAPPDWAGADLARVRDDLIAAARGHLTLALDDVTYPHLARGLSGQMRIDAAPDPTTPGALTGQVAVDMILEEALVAGLRGAGIALVQRANLRADPNAVRVSAAEPGRVSARRLSYGDALSSAAPVAAAVAALDVAIARDGWAGTLAATVVPDRIGVSVGGAGAQDLMVQAGAAGITVSGTFAAVGGFAGAVRIADGDVQVPAHDIAVQGLSATLDIADGGLRRADFAAKALRHSAEPPLIAPLSAAGTVTPRGDAIRFEAEAAGPDGVGRIAIRGDHRPAANTGELELTLAPLTFAPGGAQPGALLPGLGDLRDVAGTARAGARIAWIGGAIDGSAEAAIESMSLSGAAARVEDLSFALRLDRLQPPGSPPGQSLRIGRLDPGVPLSDLSVRFQVLPSEPPSLAIAAAEVFLAGGRFAMADMVIDAAADRHHLPIRVDGLDLAETFRLFGVEGLSGEGRLSGTIPIWIEDMTPRVAGGQLAAAGPGIVRVRSDYAKQALAGAGESADLMLRALQDFHYEELTIAIDQPGADTARLAIAMLGNNPDVLEGYPFRFNITLETDPRKLLNALSEAYRISDRAMRNLWIFRR